MTINLCHSGADKGWPIPSLICDPPLKACIAARTTKRLLRRLPRPLEEIVRFSGEENKNPRRFEKGTVNDLDGSVARHRLNGCRPDNVATFRFSENSHVRNSRNFSLAVQGV